MKGTFVMELGVTIVTIDRSLAMTIGYALFSRKSFNYRLGDLTRVMHVYSSESKDFKVPAMLLDQER